MHEEDDCTSTSVNMNGCQCKHRLTNWTMKKSFHAILLLGLLRIISVVSISVESFAFLITSAEI